MKKTALSTHLKGSLIIVLVLMFCASALWWILGQTQTYKALAFSGDAQAITQGTGIAEDPYIISTEGHLAFLIQQINGDNANNWQTKNYRVENNLNLNNVDIGIISPSKNLAFSGVFDGNNKTISDITFSESSGQSYGLFGFVDQGTIKNLNISGLSADFISINSLFAGGIAGEIYNGAVVDNCSVFSSKISAYENAGGIVGKTSDSLIEDSDVLSSSISAQVNAAGIAAAALDSTIQNCKSSNNNILSQSYVYVAGIDSVAAGITATANGSDISGCISSENTILAQRYAAGLVGVLFSTMLSNSYNTGIVRGLDGISFENNKAIRGADGADGIAGTNGVAGKAGDTGVNGGNGGSAGGLVCMLDFNSSVTNSFNAGQVTAGVGGNGGNGGDGGNGGNALGDGIRGDGGNGGVGGNGGLGGSAGALFVYFINNNLSFEFVYNKITNSFTKPNMVSLGENGSNGGSGGEGGTGGEGSDAQHNGKAGMGGHNGDNGQIVRLTNASNEICENNTPKILFNYNGGNELIPSKDVEYNQSFGTLPQPTKNTGEFVGWNTKQDGSGEVVTSGTLFLSLENITLYAQYNELMVININPNFNGAVVTQQAYHPENQIYSTLTIPTRQGWAFDGWFVDSNCSLPLDKSTSAQELTDDYAGTVYAKWQREIQIHFNLTEGSSIINTEPASLINNWQAPALGQTYVIRVSGRQLGDLPTAAPSWQNSEYYFGGWYEDLSDTSTLVAATTIYNYENLENGKITLTSRFNTNAFLEYNLMGADSIDECSETWDGSSYENYAGGNGTAANPYQIANAKQLRKMARDINANTQNNPINKAAHFILTNNIDLGGFAWEPIGTANNLSRFEGNFNGNGFYIKNLRVSRALTSGTASERYFLGFFGAVYNATISRVGLERTLETSMIELSLTGTTNLSRVGKIFVGSIVGYAAGTATIDQCYSNVPVKINVVNTNSNLGTTACIGGLIGLLDNGSYGGLGAGWNPSVNGSTFKDSYYSGDLLDYHGIGNKNNKGVSSYLSYNGGNSYNFVGGIIGFVFKSKFLNVFNTARIDISTTSRADGAGAVSFAGGICGEIQNGPSSLTNCFNTGYISAIAIKRTSGDGGDRRGEVGGVVAHLNNGGGTIAINGCKNYGDIEVSVAGVENVPGDGRDIGGIIGLITGTLGNSVTGERNYYKYNSNYFGIGSHNNGNYKSTSGNNNTPGNRNGNNLSNGPIQLKAFSSSSNYGTGDFEFTKTSYFGSDAYFNNTSGNTKWDFNNIWEFRLDRNDNLPMLKYMSYLTEYNNGAVTPNRKYVYTNERVGRLITPKRTGFSFGGWWNLPIEFDPALGGLAYDGIPAADGQDGFILYQGKNPYSLSDTNSTIFRGNNNIQIYAGWIPDISPITVNLNNIEDCTIEGSNTAAPSNINAYQNYELRQLYTPHREGYTFMGWYTETSVRYFSSTLYETSSGINLYARWQTNNYTLTLNPNGGYLPRTSYEVVFTESVGMLPTPYSFGNTFMGWQTPEGIIVDGGSIVDSDTLYDYAGNLTLTALWQPNTYEVIFDKNAAGRGTVEGINENQSFAYGQTQSLQTNSYTLSGYEFTGWALTAEGSAVYAPDAEFTMSTEGDKTLFAVWKPKSYFVRIDTQGGTVINPNNLIREGASGQRIPLPAVTKAGFDIESWYILNPSGSDILVANNYVTLENSDITVYCVWTEKYFYINFDRNDTNGSTPVIGTDPAGQTVQVSNPLGSLNQNTYSREGYTFGGWALTASGPALFDDNAPLSITQQLHNAATGIDKNQITLYAVWNPLPFVVSFDNNAAAIDRVSQGAMNSQTFYFDKTDTIAANQFSITGFTFMGWATSSENAVDKIVAYSPNEMLTLTSSIGTLYAVWEKTVYKISFHSGSQVWGANQFITFEAPAQTLISNPFSKARHNFVGWAFDTYSQTAFSELKIEDAELLYADENNEIILYAIWKAKSYDLKLYKDELMATFETLEQVEYNTPTAYDQTVFEKQGFNFLGLSLDGVVIVSPLALIIIDETYFADEFTETPKPLMAKYQPLAVEIIGLTQSTVTYKEQTTITVLAEPDDGGLSFTITDSGLEINSEGEITLMATDMESITFTVFIEHSNGSSASQTFTVAVTKRVLQVANYDADFTYDGTVQTINYQISGYAQGDTVTTQLNTDLPFKDAGDYLATIAFLDNWGDYYRFDQSGEFELIIKQRELTISGIDTERPYFTDNPAFESSLTGFAAGEDKDNLLITVQYSTLASKQSRAGTYEITQYLLPLKNYRVTYQNGSINVLPATLSGASVTLHTGEAGHVEGGKLYFNERDIVFGSEGEFTSEDYTTVWEWSVSPDPSGGWTVIEGENSNQLILTKYKLGMEVKGLYFRVRLIGQGNIASSQNITSSVNLLQQVQPPATVPYFSQNVLITLGTVAAFALATTLAVVISLIRSRLLIKRIRKTGN